MALLQWENGQDYIANPPGCPNCNIPTIKGVEVLVGRALQLAVSLAFMVAFVYLVYGGFLWLTAGSDDQKVSQAHKTITYSFFGLIILVSSLIIIKAIEVITGVNLHTFQIHFQP